MTGSIPEDKRKRLEEAFRDFEHTHGSKRTSDSQMEAALTSSDFCQNWAKTKGVLQFIASLPMVPQAVKTAIDTVIAAGDTVSSIVCS